MVGDSGAEVADGSVVEVDAGVVIGTGFTPRECPAGRALVMERQPTMDRLVIRICQK
jgi:hypothetical protein